MKCPNCNRELGLNGHFVPPMFGSEGYYICKQLNALDDKKKINNKEDNNAKTK